MLTNYHDLDKDSARILSARLREVRGAAVKSVRISRKIWTHDYNKKVIRKSSPRSENLYARDAYSTAAPAVG